MQECKTRFGDFPRTDQDSLWWEKVLAVADAEHMPSWLWSAKTLGQAGDFFGFPLRYDPDVLDQNGVPLIRSVGANGIDEGGAGDDLTFGRDVNFGYYWKEGWPVARRLGVLAALGMVALAVVFVLWKPIRRFRCSVWLGYVCAGWIVICPLLVTPAFMPTFYSDPMPWLILAQALAILVLWIIVILNAVRLVHWRFMRRRFAEGLCGTCGYDLRGLTSGRCPECGRPRS